MKKVRVCHISTVHNALDDRIFYKECVSLANNGFEVFLISNHPKNEIINNIKILAIPNFSNRIKRAINGSIIAFRMALKTKAEIFHFHDPELLLCGLLLKISGKKVIYDVHEDLPKQILYKQWISSSIIRNYLSFSIYLIEKFCALFYDGIVVVTEDIQKRFPSKKTILARNFPVLDLFPNDTRIQNQDVFTLIYAGGLTKIRGIQEIIQSIGLSNPKCKLILLGEFDDPNYLIECKKTNGWNKTEYMGKVRPDEVFKYIKNADAGFATLYPIKNYLTSLPVKAFEYMAMSKAMIMSDFPYWMEIFKDCAIFVNPYDSNKIAEAINYLISNNEIAKNLGKEGRKLVETKYSWEMEEITLINLYNQILKGGNKENS